jgi:transposase-like protein
MFSERRDMEAAKAFFRSAKTVTGITPDRVTTDGHDSYPRAIRAELGKRVRHRTSRYLTDVIDKLFLKRRPLLSGKGDHEAKSGHRETRHAAYDVHLPVAAPVRPAGGFSCQFATKRA